MFEAGYRLGNYEIVAKLQSGGMATLYLGRRAGAAGFSRQVAIKVVHPHLASEPSFVEMFIAEAKLCSHIHHPKVVHVEEFGEAAGTYYLVMEYVHGCSLAQLLKALSKKRRRMAPELAASIGLQVCDALHAAHECTDEKGRHLGVVHRDVTPQNVLLSYKGHVKLIDFGIAKAATAAGHTAAGSLKGKFRYMAPEQARGQPIDRRSDVYALGVVLWESLTARRLFDTQSELAALELAKNPQVLPPSTVAREVPPALDAVVMAALEPDRDKRIPTARELRRRLAQAVPAAAAVDDDQLAELIAALMGDELAKDDVSMTLTLSDADVQLLEQVERIPSEPPAPISHSAFDTMRPRDPGRTNVAIGAIAAGAVLLIAAAVGISIAVTSGGDVDETAGATVPPVRAQLAPPAARPPPGQPAPPVQPDQPPEPPQPAAPVQTAEPAYEANVVLDAGIAARPTPGRSRPPVKRGGRTGGANGPLLLDDRF